jgi:hypothetical protein
MFDIRQVGDLSKLFLNKYHELELALGRSEKEWDLQNASCHLMLLLLPDYMRKFGCLRNYWEGGHMGERSVTKLKKSLPHGAHLDGSVKTAIRRYFIDVVLSQIERNDQKKQFSSDQSMEDSITDEGDMCNDEKYNNNENQTKYCYDRYRRFQCYKSFDYIIDCVEHAKPFAVAYCPTRSRLYVVCWGIFESRRQRLLYMIPVTEGIAMEGIYLLPAKVILDAIPVMMGHGDGNVSRPVPFTSDIASDIEACIACPYVLTTDNVDANNNQYANDHFYYIRSENHMEMRRSSVYDNGQISDENRTATFRIYMSYPHLFKR